MPEEIRVRARQEMAYCERVLAKSGTRLLGRILPAAGLTTWTHYPDPDIFDPESGAQWYYHCHDDSPGEHGHFHCFVRPEGRAAPACHLVAIGVDSHSRLTRLFTVNHWVTGGQWLDATATNALLPRFTIELATPDYLVNRWLTAVVTCHEDTIRQLNHQRDRRLSETGRPLADVLADRTLETLSQQHLKDGPVLA